MVKNQPSEYIVRGYLESVLYAYAACLLVPFPISNVVVCSDFGHLCNPSVVGRDPVAELYLTVFQEGCQGHGLEYRSRLSRASYGHVEVLSEFSLPVSLEIHHRPYSSGLDVQHHHTSSFDLSIISDVLPESSVSYILDIYVKCCPYVISVHDFHSGAVRVGDAALVGAFHPLFSFSSMKDVVVLSFNSDKPVLLRILLAYPYVADHSSCKRTVRILSCLYLGLLHSALVLSFVEKGEFAQLQVCTVVYVLCDEHIPSSWKRI